MCRGMKERESMSGWMRGVDEKKTEGKKSGVRSRESVGCMKYLNKKSQFKRSFGVS